MSEYDLDYCIERISGGQSCTLSLFKLMDKLGFSIKWERGCSERAQIVLYIEKLIYEE